MGIKVQIEKSSDGRYYGTTQNIPGVVVADGDNLDDLKDELKKAVELYLEVAEDYDTDTFQKLQNGFEFEYDIDISELFSIFGVLNKSKFAERIGINPSLFRNYTTKKDTYISEKRAKEIERGLHQLGEELLTLKL